MAATYRIRKTIQIQMHPRVLQEHSECCECIHGKDVPGWAFNLNCTFHDRMVNRHDECSAFERKQQETGN